MKSVKELCLGVAVAGVVCGAGSVLGGAVAFADSPDSAADSAAADSRSAGQGGTRGDAGSSRSGGPARSPSAGSTARRGDSDSPAPARAATRPSTPGNDSPAPAAVKVAAPAATASSASATEVADRISTPAAAADGTPAAPVAPVATEAPAAPKSAAVSAARVLAETAAALLAAPGSPLQPVTPLPTPALPAAPAGAVTISASSTTSRSRSANATAAQIGDPDPTHVLLIGTDGTNLSKILEYAYDDPASGFRTLMSEGITGATSIVGHTTISGPSWSTILTGAWDTKTGVINNLFNPAPYFDWPTVFNQLEYFDSSIDTAVFADWQYINDIGAAGSYPVAADDNVFVPFDTSWEDTDDLVVDATIARINATSASDSTFMFSYQVAVDEAGHAYGGGSPEYAAAVVNTSENVARIMDAVDAWETANPGEEWTIIVTTDHGHQQSVGFGHGFQSPNETSSFVIFDLEGDDANNGTQNLGYANVDITPTIVNLFGAPSRSDFDGVPLQTKATGIVGPTDLKQSLNNAVAMYGYPNIGTDIALGVRTVFASVPYFLNGFVTTITGQLQSVVDMNIFLVSALAGVAEVVVQITGDILVGTTQALARVVATLTGSGVIPPSDPPLPPPAAVLPPAAILA